jgi:RHS repeat-associated protein
MSSLLRLLFLFALTASLIVPDGRILAAEPDTSRERGRPLTRLILAAPGQAKKATADGATIELGPRAVTTDTPISITPLAQQDLAALDPGMTNVTQGPRRGYRFLPHGTRFQEKIRLSLPYDKTLIPPGLTAQDIKTFYFDEQTGSWKALERVAVDAQAGVIVSLTDHFTDMINATVTVPDHPEALSYNPTSIKDIKAADPSSSINLIDAPSANSTGDARISVPIEVPPGRNGMEPEITIGYASGGGNGWLGLGWDLQLPAITIDTRWGVPRYDAALETETYLLNGEQLTPVAHRAAFQARSAEKVFHTRVEGQFAKIIRHGNQPSAYWWEVVAKDGTRFFYGGSPEGNGPAADATLTDDGGNIFRWALQETRDLNGNSVVYSYARVTDPGIEGGTVPGVQLYPKSINYTGFNGTPGAYTVTFLRDRELPEFTRRADVIIDGRGGFKQVTADLLKQIEVTFAGSLVRRYDLTYREGSFEKTLLSAVTQYGEDGTAFHTHEFGYFDDLHEENGVYPAFDPAQDWQTGADNVSAGLLGQGQASALSGTVTDSIGGHLYIGFSLMTPTKQMSVGGKVGYNRSTSNGVLAFLDLNGDELPDKVFKSGSGFAFRLNQSGPNGTTEFGPTVALPTLPAIAREKASTTSAGPEAYVGANVFANRSTTVSTGSIYFSDANGDGLPDLVTNGRVLFNHLNDQDVPTFTSNSADTPVPVGSGAVDGTDLLPNYDALYEELVDTFPLHDTLRRWVAPYDGRIQIGGTVALVEDTSPARQDYQTADGVRVAIQHNGSELWSARIGETDYAPKTPTSVDSLEVKAGDRIYFRVQSVADGAYDQVAWNPSIRYLNTPSVTDVNGLDPYAYQAADDFVLAGRSGMQVQMPITGTVRLSGDLVKHGVTTDDLTLLITKNGTPIVSKSLSWDQTGTITLDEEIQVVQGDALRLQVRVDSPIDLRQLSWRPKLVYTAATGSVRVADDQGNPLIQVDPPYAIDLYPASNLSAPQDAWTAPQAGAITVTPQLTADGDQATDGQVTFTVKRQGGLLAKRTITIADGQAAPITLPLDVQQGDNLYFTYSTSDPALAAKLANQTVAVAYGSSTPIAVPSAFYSATTPDLFAQIYRGWSYVGYNGNRDRATQPIDESRLVLDTDQLQRDGYDPSTATAYAFTPSPATNSWRGSDDRAWVSGDTISSSRLGEDAIEVPTPELVAGARAVSRLSRTKQTAIGAGISFLSGSLSDGTSGSELDYLDLNGDRFPDIVANGRAQFTTPTGGLEAQNRALPGLSLPRDSDESARNIGIGGNPASFKADARGEVNTSGQASPRGNTTGSQMVQLGFGGNLGDGKSEAETDLLDVNGDGLPDRVSQNGNTLLVALNLGYRFAAPEPWGTAVLNDGRSEQVGVNLGFNDGIYGFGGGLSLSKNESETRQTLDDLNGDGLLDRVRLNGSRISVALNTGNGFAPETLWSGTLPDGIATSESVGLGGGLYFTIAIPLCVVGCALIINPGADYNQSMARQETMFRDVDGDGYTDHVFSTDDGTLTVARNRTDRTNLLKSIDRPLGATINLEYARDGNTYDQPQSRWVLSKVAVNDGHAGDGVDTQVTTYRYEGGHYNRLEREFYGYAKVTAEQRDASNGEAVYRRVIREFHTDSYYTKGLPKRERLEDAADRPFKETEHTYRLHNVATGSELVDAQSTTATVFPQRIRTDERFYEGQATAGKSTFATYEYDALGNVTRFFDAGDTGTQDDVAATIDYSDCTDTYVVGTPVRIKVVGNGAVMRQREATLDCTTGDVTQVREVLADGTAAVTDLAYFPNGNLRTVTEPTNARGQRYQLTYEYDSVVQTHVTAVNDSFGYRSGTTYNFTYGTPTSTTDINNNRTTYTYDIFGRTASITGPYEQGGDTATIRFAYHHDATVPWAQTQHLDSFRSATDTIDTVIFIDGLKRVLQTKKDGTIHTGVDTAPQDVMLVSGRQTFDFVGRTIEQFYPVTEPLGTPGGFNTAYDAVQPTRTSYDVLDRPTQRVIPDNTATTMAYGFGPDRLGGMQFVTTVTDANGIEKKTYQNVRELTTSVQEFNTLPDGTPQVIWTSYAYDPLDQIIMVEDDHHNVTRVAYDNLGRRTAIDSPDAGKTEMLYDLASNLIAKITANLRAEGKQINYTYDFNRLASIAYPTFTGNNVTYRYGEPGAADNRAGRITLVTDESGTEERFYGKLGEITKEIKTVASATQGRSPNAPEVYTTAYVFDTFGRLQQLTYPDGEVLTYSYDSGGLVREAVGKKAQYTYSYVRRLEYDKFEQRAFMEAGNGIRTHYSYRPDNRRLENLQAGKGGGNRFQNLKYRYDNVGNILSLANDVPVPHPNTFGGPTTQSYRYDDLYRLVGASGTYQFNPDKTNRYELALSYDTIHNITSKRQHHEIVQPSGTPIAQKKTSYDWTYRYDGAQPHAPTHIGDRTFRYDANGNQTGWDHDGNGTRRNIVWDEENRIQSLFDNGHEHTYAYNDAGERVIKRGPQGETAYINQYFTMRNREVGTKHVYVGESRIVSKLLKQDKPGSNPGGQVPLEKDQYFYHADHLGSTGYVTDANGDLYQHIEYFPFGETWVEESSNTQRTPYLFTAKELDEETGLYYYGARYYDPRTSVWQSTDPILEKYLPSGEDKSKLPGMGGVYNSLNLALYSYSHQNPVKFTDPDGKAVILIPIIWGAVEVGLAGYDIYNVINTWRNPNASWSEAIGVTVGAIASIFAPGGGYSAAGKTVDGAVDAARAGSRVARPATLRVRTGFRGRIEEIQTRIGPENLGGGTPTNASSRNLARSQGRSTDDAGHGIGNILGGLGDARSNNISPQNPSINRGVYRQHEKAIADYVRRTGHHVDIKLEYKYRNPHDTRPMGVTYEVTRNGVPVFEPRTFLNP